MKKEQYEVSVGIAYFEYASILRLVVEDIVPTRDQLSLKPQKTKSNIKYSTKHKKGRTTSLNNAVRKNRLLIKKKHRSKYICKKKSIKHQRKQSKVIEEDVTADVGTICNNSSTLGKCLHSKLVVNHDYAAVCTDCGDVLADGMALFEYGCLPGSPHHSRRGSYKIVYYWNEKLAQWNRTCPRPSDEILLQFLEEAQRVATFCRPEDFSRRTIAGICRTIGRATMQEKWLMLFDYLEEQPGFKNKVKKFPKPSPQLLAKVQHCFRIVLPVWYGCKDINIKEDLELYLEEFPQYRSDSQINNLLKMVGDKKRKSFPHNFMIREFLRFVQTNYDAKFDDATIANCFDLHEMCHKQISRSIELYQKFIWKHKHSSRVL